MTTTDGDEDQAQTPATPVTNATDAMATTPSEPAAPPPDPRREALRKYAGLLLQHKVRRGRSRGRNEASEARARREKGRG